MEQNTIMEYAYWGVIEEIATLTRLRDMCLEVSDGDTANEYENRIEKSKSDFDFIIQSLGYNKESCLEVLDYEIRKKVE